MATVKGKNEGTISTSLIGKVRKDLGPRARETGRGRI